VLTGFLGGGYGSPTPAALAAAQRVSGYNLALEQTYGAKTFAALDALRGSYHAPCFWNTFDPQIAIASGRHPSAAPSSRHRGVSVAPPDVDLTVYPDECDSFGHLNQASFLSLFERARWEMLARGPGMDFFTRAAAWPAVRKAEIEYHAPAFPGDVLRFQTTLLHVGHTSFTLRQSARRVRAMFS
jgi:YbgC/YbaW family acyl-CoA thioester hydrolase